MLVRASRLGMHDNVLVPAGEEFDIKPEQFSSAWMEPVDGEAMKVKESLTASARKREVAKLEQEIAVLQKKLSKLNGPKRKTEVEVL